MSDCCNSCLSLFSLLQVFFAEYLPVILQNGLITGGGAKVLGHIYVKEFIRMLLGRIEVEGRYTVLTIYAPMIYTALCIVILMRVSTV